MLRQVQGNMIDPQRTFTAPRAQRRSEELDRIHMEQEGMHVRGG